MTPSDATARSEADADPEPLRLVTHDGLGPLDQWTVMPTEVPEEDQLTAWISVDPSAVIDLADRR
jgi:hypothetical protein